MSFKKMESKLDSLIERLNKQNKQAEEINRRSAETEARRKVLEEQFLEYVSKYENETGKKLSRGTLEETIDKFRSEAEKVTSELEKDLNVQKEVLDLIASERYEEAEKLQKTWKSRGKGKEEELEDEESEEDSPMGVDADDEGELEEDKVEWESVEPKENGSDSFLTVESALEDLERKAEEDSEDGMEYDDVFSFSDLFDDDEEEPVGVGEESSDGLNGLEEDSNPFSDLLDGTEFSM